MRRDVRRVTCRVPTQADLRTSTKTHCRHARDVHLLVAQPSMHWPNVVPKRGAVVVADLTPQPCRVGSDRVEGMYLSLRRQRSIPARVDAEVRASVDDATGGQYFVAEEEQQPEERP